MQATETTIAPDWPAANGLLLVTPGQQGAVVTRPRKVTLTEVLNVFKTLQKSCTNMLPLTYLGGDESVSIILSKPGCSLYALCSLKNLIDIGGLYMLQSTKDQAKPQQLRGFLRAHEF